MVRFVLGALENFIREKLLSPLKNKMFENFVKKGVNADDHYSILFPQCFLPIQKQI